jgi:hypothetical protein
MAIHFLKVKQYVYQKLENKTTLLLLQNYVVIKIPQLQIFEKAIDLVHF